MALILKVYGDLKFVGIVNVEKTNG